MLKQKNKMKVTDSDAATKCFLILYLKFDLKQGYIKGTNNVLPSL